jgi:hypothetical protein
LRTAAGLIVQLGTFDQQHRETEQARKEFEQALAKEPGLKEKLEAKRRSALSDAERTALDTKDKERGRQQQTLAEEAQAKLRLSHRDIAAGMTDAQHRVDALKLADRLVAAEYREHMVAMYRDIVNFKYWQVRCDVERRDETVKARRQIHEGDAALARSDIKGALEHYNSGLRQWWEVIKKDAVKDKESVLEKYPLLAEKSIVMELMQIIEKYEQQILKQNNLPLPQPFVLEPVKKANEEHERRDRQPAEVAGT